MIIPMILAIVAAILYASTNHIDKFLISKMVKNANYRALILVSLIIAGAVMSVIYLFVCGFKFEFDLTSFLILLLNSIIYTIANIFWFKALNREDTSLVVIMFQLIPIFVLLLSPLFLPEQNIRTIQLIGGLIVTLAAIFVTFEPSKKKFNKDRVVTLLMMALASAGYAIWYILERYVNLTQDFNQTTFWSNVALLLVGIIIFVFIESYRSAFVKLLKTNGKKVIGLNLLNELFNSFAGVLTTFAGTMTSVALVSFTAQSVQPFMVLLIGILIAKFFPNIEKENITKSTVVMRVAMIMICIIGLACIEFG